MEYYGLCTYKYLFLTFQAGSKCRCILSIAFNFVVFKHTIFEEDLNYL